MTASNGTTINTYSISALRLPIANITSASGTICAGNTASFNIAGTSGAILTYKINNGSEETTTLTGGTATISIPSVSVTQILNLVSISEGAFTKSLSEYDTVIVNAFTYSLSIWCNNRLH